MIVVATLLRDLDLEVYPRDYEMTVRVAPLRMPDKRFRLRVAARR